MLKNERGQALTEFALVLPLILILVCGMFDFGRIMYTHMSLNIISQEAVRLGALGDNDEVIIQFTEDHFTVGDSSELTVQVSPDDSQRKSGDYITVSIEYPINYVTPLISSIFPSPYVVNTSSTIRVE